MFQARAMAKQGLIKEQDYIKIEQKIG